MPAASSQHPADGANAPIAVADHHGGRVVIGYVRVSTEEQGASGLGLEAHRSAITAECARRGWRLARIEEDASSGTRLDRPGLTAAVEAVASAEVEEPIVAKLDRLSRSVAHFSTLLERFRSKGWGLVILDLGIDTTTIMGEAMATMAATFAQVERRLISQRTKEGAPGQARERRPARTSADDAAVCRQANSASPSSGRLPREDRGRPERGGRADRARRRAVVRGNCPPRLASDVVAVKGAAFPSVLSSGAGPDLGPGVARSGGCEQV